MGLVRERVFAHYFGNSPAAAAVRAAFRIPNFLQNLFGEGVLSASFIPVYAALLGKGEREESDKVASAIFAVLALFVSVIVAVGVLATPLFADLTVMGFEGEQRELAISLVRIMFPGAGVLVLSAWCLGVLNSHRRFFLSYAAPVMWNLVLIAALLIWGGRVELEVLAEYVTWGAVLGSVLQFLVQLPAVLSLLGKFRPVLDLARESVRAVFKSFVPVVIGRGVVQISAYVDTNIASLLGGRAFSALNYAQTIYLLPVSLFGMSVSAAELPEMSRLAGDMTDIADKLRERLATGLRRIYFFVIPSSVAMFTLGDVIGAAIFQTGRFDAGDSRYLWYLLAGAAVGLVATTTGRLYSSAFYAMKDTKTPLRFAVVRVTASAMLAYLAAIEIPAQLGYPREIGAVGITAMSGAAAWIEKTLLARALEKRIGRTGADRKLVAVMYAAALGGALGALAVKIGLSKYFGEKLSTEFAGSFLPAPAVHPVLAAALILGVFGVIYFLVTALAGVPEAKGVLRRVLRRR
jgi:putative peptidoglycan lipid II flippase